MRLSRERRYEPEALMARVMRRRRPNSPLQNMPLWVLMDGHHIQLSSRDEIWLACRMACIYHNNGPNCRAPYEDGWNEETWAMERRAEEHMLAEDSTDSSDEDEPQIQ